MNDNIPQKVIDAIRSAWHIEGDLTNQVNIEELTHEWIVYELDPPRASTKQTDPDAREQIAPEHPAPFRLENLGMLRLVVPKNGKNWFLVTSGDAADKESGVSGEYDVTVESCPNPSQEAAAALAEHLYRPNPESIRALENDDLEAFLSLDQVVYLSLEDALRALQHTPFHLGIYAISEPISLIKALKPYQVRISLVRPCESGGYHSDNVV